MSDNKLDEFESAEKQEIQQPETFSENKGLINHRVFLNHVDSFNSKYIASYLTDQIYGASRIQGAEEGQDEEIPVTSDIKTDTEDKNNYEIIGTKKYGYSRESEDILFILSENSTESNTFKTELLKCKYVVYDITQDVAEIPKALNALSMIIKKIENVKDLGEKTFHNFMEERVFILISTVMTWARTKPLDPDDPDFAFTEANYRKRKPHPNYAEQIKCEREVVLKGKTYINNLKTYVLCSGIIYGNEEEDLQYMFRLAWSNEKYLPCFLPGNNVIPLIHIGDLARVLHKLIEINPGKPQYINAVEPTATNLRKIVTALSKYLGTGKIKDTAKEEAFLYNSITQTNYERTADINVKIEPEYASDALQVEWQSELSLSDNMNKIVQEFLTKLNLYPIKIIIHGPPTAGKTRLAYRICDKYGLHYVSVKTMINEILDDLRSNISSEKERLKLLEQRLKEKELLNQAKEEEIELGEEEEDEEEGIDMQDLEDQIRDITSTMSEAANGRLPDEQVVKLMRSFLVKNICQNQGYILDGYPKTMQQVKEIFGQASEEGGEEEEADNTGNANNKILPDFVISLQADDEFLIGRILELPEFEIQDTHYNEEGMMRRLAEFHANNTEDNTILNFFEEIEIQPVLIDIKDDKSENMDCIFDYVCKLMGPPKGFPLSHEEISELERLKEEEKKLEEEAEKIRSQMEENKCLSEHQEKMEKWADALQQLQHEEEKLLVARTEPLRYYLMKYIFPTLTKGLTEVVTVKPNNPIDFLAEFLFRENPEGKMFDPSYSKDGEELLDNIESNIEPILNINE